MPVLGTDLVTIEGRPVVDQKEGGDGDTGSY